MGEHSASGHRLLKWGVGILVILLLGGAVLLLWPKSPRHTHAADIREARAAGFWWKESEDPSEAITRNWHNAIRKETGESYRWLVHYKEPDLTPYRSLIHRLNPTHLEVHGCKNVDALEGLTELQGLILYDCRALQNMDVLKGLTALKELWLSYCSALQNVDVLKGLTALLYLRLTDCPALQNADVLKGLTALQHLDLTDCPALQNVDGLKGLTALQWLWLSGCPALQNVDGLKGLTALHSLDLINCPALQNVDGLKGLTALQVLNLEGSTGIPAPALRALRVALPQTNITFPDGTSAPPP